MTHNLTHNRKRAGGGNGAKSTIASAFLEQKCPQSAEWRRFEGWKSVGKDRETGPCRNSTVINRSDSSSNTREISNIQHFYCVSAPVRFCNFSPNKECKKTAGKGVQPLNNYTCRFRPSSLNCTDKSGLDGLQADKWISG